MPTRACLVTTTVGVEVSEGEVVSSGSGGDSPRGVGEGAIVTVGITSGGGTTVAVGCGEGWVGSGVLDRVGATVGIDAVCSGEGVTVGTPVGVEVGFRVAVTGDGEMVSLVGEFVGGGVSVGRRGGVDDAGGSVVVVGV
ncbi:MAG: hypothetical protein GY764_02645 [Halieaceae bacterium]|nr:hypothetical protein [Halieaceae bacterium]